ncbi:PMS1 protein homolog 1 isoform X2 [Alosa sapidissima]|uniref:PMS1 protein homolog 1 isoform X2 n=1 Tax=Alosa sapidissima TaxID=34773 RepID=UPI001C092EDA|nr:PMS1 protein homolog 1 isoform X2 [Alosa sapidissima]
MKQLPAETVRLLSSSQVITSIVSVVKELIENSLDAGSTSIDVKLENYGLDRIEVRDNGSGIKAADTAVMAVKHYTSKISSHDDLMQLETYGFRGEALGSICAVSEVVVTTKTAEEDFSTQYTLNLTGHIVSQKPSHLGQGTTVCALKLFKNLPVRRQYYSNTKKCKEELKKVQDLLMAYAVVKPELRITFAHNKVVVWQKSRVSDHRAALMAVIGAALMANMFPLQHRQEHPEISIEGFFPKPDSDYASASSSNPDRTFVFVNNRPVHHKDIMKLVKQFCSRDPSCRRYPILVMNIMVPSSAVDVNLTPDKTQVMLQNKEAVLAAVESMLVSLYGPLADAEGSVSCEVTGDGSASGSLATHQQLPGNTRNNDADPDAQDVLSHNAAVSPQTPLDCSDVDLFGTIATKTGDPASNTSLNQTSSSSSSEDWIINKSLFDLSHVNGSLLDDDCLSTGDTKDGGKESADLFAVTPSADCSISAESWSRGRGLTDPVTGGCLEPVKLHVPSEPRGVPETIDKCRSSPSKKLSNVIVARMPKPTAYELIGSRPVRQPLSARALFERDCRVSILQEDPGAGVQDVTTAVKERWESLGEEDRKKYEEKAKKAVDVYNLQKLRAEEGQTPARDGKRLQSAVDSPASKPQGLKRKAPLSNQQLLDKLFSSQPLKKSAPAKVSKPLPFCLAALKRRLNLLSSQSGSGPQGLRLVNRLASHCAWVVLCGRELMLLNPFRVEEALLFKRLLENNILPAACLQTPIQLTDGVLGGSECMDVLYDMSKGQQELNGTTYFSDPRLVANGFQIRLSPGLSSTERHMEVASMADCMPFFGIADLREILTAVKDRQAETVRQCRPMKATRYLEGEAVRMVRQLPLNQSRDDVENTLSRMREQLGEEAQSCIHGRPFFHLLSKVPETDEEALVTLSNT